MKERLIFGKTGWIIDFIGCGEVIAGVSIVFQGWNIRSTANKRPSPKTKVATISEKAGRWHWKQVAKVKPRFWDSIPPKENLRVVNDILDSSIYWYLEDNPNHLCLHAAAAEIGGGLVCFPALHKSGKSTLMAAFSAQGIRTFGDDVLILKKGQGMSFGFLTRLRSPLPKSLSASLLRYITKHTGPSNHKWIYLKPENPVQFGECKPIKAFVLLERNPQARAALEPIREVDVLKRLVEDNIIRTLPLRIIFDRLHRLCKSRQRFRLTYSDPEEAVRLMINKFS